METVGGALEYIATRFSAAVRCLRERKSIAGRKPANKRKDFAFIRTHCDNTTHVINNFFDNS